MAKKKSTKLQVLTDEITDLTVCRAIFAGWVFLYHVNLHAQFAGYLGPAAGLIRRGYLGVDGFFILSGLLLMQVHIEFSEGFQGSLRFLGKRLARIYPVHLATILILLALVAAGSAAGLAPQDPGRFSVTSLVQNLLLIQGWGFGNQLAWNYPSWSISAEWAGYLLFPLIAFSFFSWTSIVAGQALVLCFPILGLLGFLSGHGLNITSGPVLVRSLAELVLGITAAKLVPYWADKVASPILAGIGLGIILFSVLFGTDMLVLMGLCLALTALSMQAHARNPSIFGKAGILRALGLLSYSFYMSFAISEVVLAQIFRHQGWDPAVDKLGYTAAMTLLTFVLAIALHFIVEKPSRRLAARWMSVRVPLEIAPP